MTGASGPEPTYAVASYAQERVWLAGQMAPDGPLYHVADEFTVHARVSETQLREVFDVVAARHESLRTCFRLSDGVLTQAVYPVIQPALESLDIRELTPDRQHFIRASAYERLVGQPFDLDRAPLWRAALFQIAEDGWVVIFVAHHTIFDPESAFNLHAEITEQCAAAEQGREAKLPELPLGYTAYAASQRNRLAGARGAELLAFWADQLRDLPVVHRVPLDRLRPSRRTFAGAEAHTKLPAATLRAVTALARANQTIDFTVLLAAYSGLLHQYSGVDDVVVGVPAAGRYEPDLRSMIGAFVNMLVIRIDTSGDPAFTELVVRVRDRVAEAWKYQDLPFQQAVEHFGYPRVPGAAPLYQCGFNSHENRPRRSASNTAEDELFLEVAGNGVRLEYNTALFDAATVGTILDDYVRILLAGLAKPDAPLSRLPVAPVPVQPPASAGESTIQPGPSAARFGRSLPRTECEALVADVWSQVLRTPATGVFDDFFGAGGHSLQVLRVLAGIKARTGAQPTVQAFFADPTIAGLAAEIEGILGRRTA